jgi:predicted O-methyltransferase YrrM
VKLFGPAPRAQNDYATHIPILLSLARAIKVEKVLELGCGNYSTLTFLNPTAFPSLVVLDSLETNQAWLDKIVATVGSDPRLRPRFVPNSMLSAIEKADLEDYDLIFVDDSASSEERSATIREISHRGPRHAVVAIHDFEVEAHARAARAFRRKFVFKAFTPQTGVVWNGDRGLTTDLRRAELAVRRHAKMFEPDDVRGWAKALADLTQNGRTLD